MAVISFSFSVRTVFGDTAAGRLRLYQTADVVLLLLNHGMKGAAGTCFSSLNDPEGSQKKYPFATFVASYSKISYSFITNIFEDITLYYTNYQVKVLIRALLYYS